MYDQLTTFKIRFQVSHVCIAGPGVQLIEVTLFF